MLYTSEYASEEIGDAHVVARESALEFIREAIRSAETLYDYAASLPGARSIRGRQPVYVIPSPDSHRWVIRHLSHGGLLAPLTGDRFLRLGVARPFNELALSVKLREIDIPTPAVVAAVVYHSGATYRGDVAREEVTDAFDLAECIFGSKLPDSLRPEALAAAGRLIGSLHRAGVVHPDLNVRNVLLRWREKRPLAYILDVEKCRIRSGLSRLARRRMLNRFQRSTRKLERRAGQRISRDEWGAFLAAYALAFTGSVENA